MPGKGGLQLTGKLGEVIRESAQIALSWVKSHAYELGITKTASEQFMTDIDVHVHMPEGSIGKEGPSAGTALLTAFVSLFTKTKVHPDIGSFISFANLKCVLTQSCICSYDRRDFPRRASSTCWWFEGENSRCSSCWYQDYHRA